MKATSPILRRRLLALTLAAACVGSVYAAAPTVAPASKPDVVADHIDTSVKPGDDFFEFANGAWLKSHPIPAEESQWGIGQVVQDELYAKLRKISENAAADKSAKPGSDEQKVGDFWTIAMDQPLADKLGITPLKEELSRIDAVHDVNSTLDEAFALQQIGVGLFFDFALSQDEKQSDVMAVHLWQGGLGLPERDYYFNQEKGVAKVRTAYVGHLQRVFHLLGKSDAEAAASAKQVMAFETALAKVSRPLADLRDPEKNYNKMAPADLTSTYTPSIAWNTRLAGWKLPASTVIVGQPEFFKGLQALLSKTPAPVLRDYMRVHLVDAYASYLSQDFDNERFSFYGTTLNGQAEQKPRWKRALRAENQALGMILGRIYVKDYFSEAAKQRYNTMVEAVRTAYAERIDKLDWMSPATKAKAHEKLEAVTKKVGYPDKWKDYSKLTIGRTSYAQNMMNAARWEFDDTVAKFGKPVDRSEWEMTPQTYNAYYNPSNNEIVLPAAQFIIPGFTDDQIDDAVVYGYVAASTIGHEITHGFDDEGRQYDAKGNLKDWWTKEDAERFKQRADVMVKQFNAYEPLPGLHINGKASLGENIADFGGIMIGLDAFKKTEQYKKGEKIAGYTPLQRFFLGYALGWLSQEREQQLRTGLLADVHAPAKWRVNGPLSNVPDFYQAFDVKQGQPMWRPEDQRVKIW
ncbi:M13 family metallopeptidase [Dyella japonica]|uniref:Metalloendopeptidase n=1 Tax=Dyella japonica A8 TaxID=1217721 RepID=A0A075JYN5_9GAMM|nr:M13 family metallopeptidase [Dyella japonica]AIF47186.1 metalloendopeptidase [Dyella japonica A8]